MRMLWIVIKERWCGVNLPSSGLTKKVSRCSFVLDDADNLAEHDDRVSLHHGDAPEAFARVDHKRLQRLVIDDTTCRL